MKFVVVDGDTLNPGDLSWSELEELGSLEVFKETPQELLLERARTSEVAITNKVVFDAETIAVLDKLRCIVVTATGVNVVDVKAARERDIPVLNAPAYSTRSVAQMTFAHILELTQCVGMHSAGVKSGKWTSTGKWCYWETPLVELEGLTMGIIGYGRIGKQVAGLAKAFGMQVIVHSTRAEFEEVEYVQLEELFSRSDVVSLHCPLKTDNKHLVNAERLKLMKKSAFLINTGRGPLIDEQALAGALNSGRIAGAGLDVLSVEPPLADNPLLNAVNCHITPHIAWATRASRERLMKITVENVKSFLQGHPQNVVN